ncbi:MAG: hypothetical protein KJN60_00175 [Boseongicola sp.]|nr:hypothetical protein [Boseongicola sp.]
MTELSIEGDPRLVRQLAKAYLTAAGGTSVLYVAANAKQAAAHANRLANSLNLKPSEFNSSTLTLRCGRADIKFVSLLFEPREYTCWLGVVQFDSAARPHLDASKYNWERWDRWATFALGKNSRYKPKRKVA